MLPVLIVEDDADLRAALADTLALSGYVPLQADHGEAALAVLRTHEVGLVLSDVQMPGLDGHRLLAAIRQEWPAVPVLLMTAYAVIDRAVDAMRSGACGYLAKPFEPERLAAEVARYLRTGRSSGAPIGADGAMHGILQAAARVAGTDATVLITGESGTGKERMARHIHALSARREGPFVAINCAAIPEHLLESLLFGYEKGAFSGAVAAHPGKFEQAQGGSLLLDEVTEMPLALQAKLLRVIQEREVERLGGRRPVPLDVRLMATSNRQLEQAVREGAFREDLYYRLNVFPVSLPPLRERPGDIAGLAHHFVEQHRSALGKPGILLSAQALAKLTLYRWPGNIRELENVMQRAIILAPQDTIRVEDLLLPDSVSEPRAKTPPAATLKELEKAHILETLREVGGSRKLAGAKLGMSERTLRYKLQQYRLAEGQSGHFATPMERGGV